MILDDSNTKNNDGGVLILRSLSEGGSSFVLRPSPFVLRPSPFVLYTSISLDIKND